MPSISIRNYRLRSTETGLHHPWKEFCPKRRSTKSERSSRGHVPQKLPRLMSLRVTLPEMVRNSLTTFLFLTQLPRDIPCACWNFRLHGANILSRIRTELPVSAH